MTVLNNETEQKIMTKPLVKVDCRKCDKTGYINAFSHVKRGICFSCGGHGFNMLKNKPRIQKRYEIGFLWADKNHCNYNNGEILMVWGAQGYASLPAANRRAEAAMKKMEALIIL
jgi:hypothetical protein